MNAFDAVIQTIAYIIKTFFKIVFAVLLSGSDEDQKIERNEWNRSNLPQDQGQDVHRDEYGNLIDENGEIDEYR